MLLERKDVERLARIVARAGPVGKAESRLADRHAFVVEPAIELQELPEMAELVLGHGGVERMDVDRLGEQLRHPRLEAVHHLPPRMDLAAEVPAGRAWLLTKVSIGTLNRLA